MRHLLPVLRWLFDGMHLIFPVPLTLPGPRMLAALGFTALIILSSGLALAAVKPSPRSLKASPIPIDARPISSFDRASSSKMRFGRLVWRGGLVLTSPSPHFGGWSAIEMSPDGRAFLAVSDAGTWLRGRLTYAGVAPRGVDGAVIGPIQAKNGTPLARSRDRDAEGLALVRGSIESGEVYVSFEGNHRVGRFPLTREGLGTPTGYLANPKDLKRSRRDGMESLATIDGGRFKGALVAFAEEADEGTGYHRGWIWVRGEARQLNVVSRDGFALTAAASLEDGSLLLLERRFRILEGVRMRMRLIQADKIEPGAVLDGETLIQADLGQEIDNMEGLGVHTESDGTTVLTILSDDNFNPVLQRTLLLQFSLERPLVK